MADVASGKTRRTSADSGAALPTVVDAVKALAHPGRLRMLAMLRGGDLCVCQLTAVLGLAASTVSSHLSDLRRAGLVAERKSGKWVHYHLIETGPLAGLVQQALRLADDDGRLEEDARVVDRLRRVPLETFCSTGFDRTRIGLTAPASRTVSGTRRRAARHSGRR